MFSIILQYKWGCQGLLLPPGTTTYFAEQDSFTLRNVLFCINYYPTVYVFFISRTSFLVTKGKSTQVGIVTNNFRSKSSSNPMANPPVKSAPNCANFLVDSVKKNSQWF